MLRALLGWIFYLFYPSVPARAKASFYASLEGLHDSGISVLQTFQSLASSGGNPRLRRAARRILKRISKGDGLSEAMSRHPYIFSRFEVGLVGAGEGAGKLDRVYGALARLFEWHAATTDEILVALTKPLVTLLFVVFFWPLLAFLLPADVLDAGLDFAGEADNAILEAVRASLEWANATAGGVWTRLAGIEALHPATGPVGILLEDIPYRMRLYLQATFVPLMVVVPCILAAAIVAAHLRRLPLLGHLLDFLRLILPLWSGIERKAALASFSFAFGTAFASGTEVMKCLSLARSAVGNWIVAWRLSSLVRRFLAGDIPAHRLRMGGFFPPVFAEMMETGIRTGEIDVYLDKVTHRLTREVQNDLKRIMTFMTVATYVLIALPVLGILIAAFHALFGRARELLRGLRLP